MVVVKVANSVSPCLYFAQYFNLQVDKEFHPKKWEGPMCRNVPPKDMLTS